MKTKWLVEYWNDDMDKEVKHGFHSYEDAITHAEKVKRKFNRTARIYLR